MPTSTTEERVATCSGCQRWRRDREPNRIAQRKLAAIFGQDFWYPKICADCNREIERTQREREVREKQLRLECELKGSRLPRAYVTGARGVSDLLRAPATDGFAVARKLCARLGTGSLARPWIWIWSAEVGTYKTTLACCALHSAIIDNGRGETGHGRFVNVPDMFADLRATYGKKSELDESDVIDPLLDTPRLVLDDIGVEKPSEHNAEVLYRIINRRFELDANAKPGSRWTIFTSNLPISGFVMRYADAIGDKMAARLERRLMELAFEAPVSA